MKLTILIINIAAALVVTVQANLALSDNIENLTDAVGSNPSLDSLFLHSRRSLYDVDRLLTRSDGSIDSGQMIDAVNAFHENGGGYDKRDAIHALDDNDCHVHSPPAANTPHESGTMVDKRDEINTSDGDDYCGVKSSPP